ncbi:hormogonium polysaccharide secretion pseudopilin HpsC [Anabaena azotica]|uniref:hormogonium polysaccharide secretion pseudopilin HpsC n=1 Tax=Anabaena azotica TaxID=197653 RepID=UPI0039A6F780
MKLIDLSVLICVYLRLWRASQFRKNIENRHSEQNSPGFTLIEILVGLGMAAIIISSLLGFMISVMNTEKNEQAKAISEQEIQAALDYISRDLQEAVYIYDAAGIDAIRTQLPSSSARDRVPVMVFWKRELVADAVRDDTFVYSLVAYYLIKDSSSTWSKAARIGRWQIKDGVTTSSNDSTGVDCTGYPGSKYVRNYCPSPGFSLFDITQHGTLEQKMNRWIKNTVAYTNDIVVLIDYIDQTITNIPPATCPENVQNPDDSTQNLITWSKVPPPSFNNINTGKMTGFYVCVDRVNTIAQVFIRGNALARINNNAGINYSSERKSYFPTGSIKVQGRGYLYK